MTDADHRRKRRNSIFVVGIAGCSGSGKTSLALELARELGGTHFPLDHYYRDLAHLPHEERSQQDFDHPDAMETALLVQHVTALAAGLHIERPVYDFANHTRLYDKTERIEPGKYLLVDGIFALHYEELRALYDLGVYVEAPYDVCFARRLARDVRERGRTAACVAEQYERTVRPMAEMFVRPSAAYADLVVDGTRSLDWSVEEVLAQLRLRDKLAYGDDTAGQSHRTAD
jgi:uridine kinase